MSDTILPDPHHYCEKRKKLVYTTEDECPYDHD